MRGDKYFHHEPVEQQPSRSLPALPWAGQRENMMARNIFLAAVLAAGMVDLFGHGVVSVPARERLAAAVNRPPAKATEIHKVQRGDTLYSIYKSKAPVGAYWPEWKHETMRLSGLKVSEIHIGQKLVLPPSR